MRILLISRGYPPYGRFGAEALAASIARGMVRRGHEVAVFFPTEAEIRPPESALPLTGSLFRWDEDDGVRLYVKRLQPLRGKPFEPSFLDERQDRALVELLKQDRFDRVHATALCGGVSAGLLLRAAEAGIPVSLTLTEFLPLCHRGQLLDNECMRCPGPEPRRCTYCSLAPGPWDDAPLKQRMKTWIGRVLSPLGNRIRIPTPAAFAKRGRLVARVVEACDFLHFPSEGLHARYMRAGWPREKSVVRSYGFDFGNLRGRRAESRRGGKEPPEVLKIGFLGQIAPHKGPQVLVEALAAMEPSKRGGYEVHLHGAPPAYGHPLFPGELRRAAEGLPVCFDGPFEPGELSSVLASLDFVAIPSLWVENLPLVLLQAQAAGVPLLVSDEEGMAPYVRDGWDGLCLLTGSPPAWAEGLRRLREEEGLYAALQEGASLSPLPPGLEDFLRFFEKRFETAS